MDEGAASLGGGRKRPGAHTRTNGAAVPHRQGGVGGERERGGGGWGKKKGWDEVGGMAWPIYLSIYLSIYRYIYIWIRQARASTYNII